MQSVGLLFRKKLILQSMPAMTICPRHSGGADVKFTLELYVKYPRPRCTTALMDSGENWIDTVIPVIWIHRYPSVGKEPPENPERVHICAPLEVAGQVLASNIFLSIRSLTDTPIRSTHVRVLHGVQNTVRPSIDPPTLCAAEGHEKKKDTPFKPFGCSANGVVNFFINISPRLSIQTPGARYVWNLESTPPPSSIATLVGSDAGGIR